jgi:hypothetical protein
MGLIDKSYFVKEISLPSETLDINDNFNGNIDRYEPEILTDLLGYELYKALLADLDGNGDPQTQRFIDLIDGAEFTFEYGGYDVNEKWNGFRNAEKISICSYYVYYKYRSDTDTFYTSGGQSQALTENSDAVSQYAKLTDAWNRMIDLYGEGCYYYSIYRGTTIRDTSNLDHSNDEPSAYNFLLANVDDYPEWVYKPKYKINQFGI